MERYLLGQTVRLPVQSHDGGRRAPVNRVEIIRPDGSTTGKDWDQHRWQTRVNQTGIWRWRIFIRADDATSIQSGEFEVVGGQHTMRIQPKIRLLSRIRGGSK